MTSMLDGAPVAVTIIKATFDISDPAHPVMAATQEPVIITPMFVADDPAATVLRCVENTPDHDGTDVIINACAHAPDGVPVETMQVDARIADRQIAMSVTGNRVWEKRMLQVRPSAPDPFTKMPLIYERAFGGGHASSSGATPVEDRRNPAGCGYCEDATALIGTPVPNIEWPDSLLSRAKNTVQTPVAGFAAIPPSWEPRSTLAGTYDDLWERTRMPHWPVDAQPDFFRVAHPALQFSEALRGHEIITLTNMTANGSLSFRLPRLIPTVRNRIHGAWSRQQVPLRRVIIEPEQNRLVMVWRALTLCGSDPRVIEKTTVDLRRMVRAGKGTA